MKPSYSRPFPAVILRDPVHLLAFGFGSGLAPVAPGTFGTLVAIPLYLVMMWLPPVAYLVVTGLLFGVGVYVCGESAKRLGMHDHPGIVFDEIVGYLVTLAPLTPGMLGYMTPAPQWYWMLVGFVVFRVFDIAKPAFIHKVDAGVHGGLGIMLDDLLAALCSAGVMMLIASPSILFGE